MHRVIAEGKVLFIGPCMEEPMVPGRLIEMLAANA